MQIENLKTPNTPKPGLGDALWVRANGSRPSSSRTEAIAVWLAMFTAAPAHLGVDNAAAVSNLGKLLAGKRRTKPFGLMRDGDVWQRVGHALEARGRLTARCSKVRARTTQEQRERGLESRWNNLGNEMADILAKQGRELAGRWGARFPVD